LWEYFPPIYKKELKDNNIIIINITGGGILAFFDDVLTTFRNKNYRFICNVEKIK